MKNVNHLIVATLNINSIRYKFDQLKFLIQDKIDILILQETKIDHTFPVNRFMMDGYSPPFRRDRTCMGGGILVYIKDNIPAKILNVSETIEGMFIELSLKCNKWLLFCTYNPSGQCSREYFTELEKEIEVYLTKYDRILLIGDFNQEETDPNMSNFMVNYGLSNIVKDKTCFKNPNNPSCIDLILTNKPRSFQHTTTFDIGLSDFHRMVLTSFKCIFDKREPKEVVYRNYKNFENKKFREELGTIIHGTADWESFELSTLKVIDRHAPIKKKTIRANHKPYVTKELRKAIMKKNQLAKKRFNSEDVNKQYKKQKNYVDRESKRAIKQYFNGLDVRQIQDNKKFWKIFGENLSDKIKGKQKITLVKANEILTDDKLIADEFSSFFDEAVGKLEIPSILLSNVDGIQDPIDIAINKYKNHPSILKIIEKIPINRHEFYFEKTNNARVFKWIKSIKPGKATTFKHIPSKILTENADIFTPKMSELIDNGIETNVFPDTPKYADVCPVHKKGDRTNAEKYRPVSVVNHTGKVFEKDMHYQISTFMNGILSNKLCGYRKGYSTQHALISMTEQWRKSLDNKGFAGAVLMDLSKAFDCMNHELLLAKLHAYGFSKDALQLICSYLKNRWQRVKINTSFSQWTELLLGVPQGSVLGPLLFNIYLNDLIWFIDGDVTNFADDTTPHECSEFLDTLKIKLEKDSKSALLWFKNNYMKLNTDKCKLIVAGRKDQEVSVRVGNSEIRENKEVELLGVTIDNQLSFSTHLNSKIKKANSKLITIARYQHFLTFRQKKIALSSFVHCHFSYAPLVWMFHSREINNRINRVHKKALRILYNDNESSFEVLLKRDEGFTVHERNLQKLMTEMFKAKNRLEPHLLQGIFEASDYNGPKLRSSKHFKRPNVNTVKYGDKSLQNLGVQLWNQLPQSVQEIKTLSKFKADIHNWRPQKCPCDICKDYIYGLGYTRVCDCPNC